MKKKYLEGTGWSYIGKHHAYHYKEGKNLYALVEFHDVVGHVPVDYDESGKRLLENGSIGIMKINNNKFSSSVVYDRKHQIQEWYFDMIVSRGYDVKPFIFDAYLDVAVSPDRKARLLDEDELEEAYEKDFISRSDRITAYETGSYIMNHLIHDDQYMIHDFNNLKAAMLEKKNDLLEVSKEFLTIDSAHHIHLQVDDRLSFEDNCLHAFQTFDCIIENKDVLYLIVNDANDHHDVYSYFEHDACFKSVDEDTDKNVWLKSYYYPIDKSKVNYKGIIQDKLHKTMGRDKGICAEVYIYNQSKDTVIDFSVKE